ILFQALADYMILRRLQQIAGSLTKFINDTGSEPTLDKVMITKDSTGEPWILLDASIAQGDPEADKPWRGLQQSFHLNSWFIPANNSGRALPHLPRIIRTGDHDLVKSHGHVDCCYFGEIGWSPYSCSYRHTDFININVKADRENFQVVSTVEDYLWEGSLYDCSIGESVSARLPSAFIQSRSSLTLDEHGPSWLDNGKVVFTNHLSSDHDRQQGFLVRASWLSVFMKAHAVDLVATASTLRWRVTGYYHYSDEHNPEQDDRLDVYAAVRINPDLGLSLAPPRRLLNHNDV
ncbi:MAG: hypothetical protein ACREXR_14710, partial [Gammaproteobacteria bacterium]